MLKKLTELFDRVIPGGLEGLPALVIIYLMFLLLRTVSPLFALADAACLVIIWLPDIVYSLRRRELKTALIHFIALLVFVLSIAGLAHWLGFYDAIHHHHVSW